MTTIKTHAEIDSEGKLRLEIPVGLPAGHAEVLVVVQPDMPHVNSLTSRAVARSGLFFGKGGDPLNPDLALPELQESWKSKLQDLK